jgi:uncharacterized repeat protein (TIGR03803 family)
MTKTRAHDQFNFPRAWSPRTAARKLISWKMACIAFAFCAATAIASAQRFTTLASFDGYDGNDPYTMSLVQGFDGNLYGTTHAGGTAGLGTVFKVTPTGVITALYSFCSQPNCVDGSDPEGGLVQAIDGNLYGTTFYGGAYGSGTVFRITASGTLTTLYSFCSQQGVGGHCLDGSGPQAELVQAADGNFYGTTAYGGITLYPSGGTAFRITSAGTLTTIYSFCSQTNCTDGEQPYAGLVQASNGNFYGTTYAGGAHGGGTVLELTPAGKLNTLYSFCSQFGCPDGRLPWAGLVQATNGDFYGTTEGGGANGYGTVFKLTLAGKLTTLYSFCSQTNCTDGEYPYAGLVQATDGNFYGTTNGAGPDLCDEVTGKYGTAFAIRSSGALTTLHTFDDVDGACPYGALAQATNGNLYGTTWSGGEFDDGVVLALSVGLKPFVETLPTSGKVGRTVIILGNNLTGATSVTFNSTSGTFTVVSDTEIKTTVPTGATTGTVEVTTPSGTLKSNVVFHVKS